jgi:hypothetical protein
MTRDTKELERVLEELEKLSQLVSKTTWDEVTVLWGLMYENYRKLGCERALKIIEQLFADRQIRKQVGAARQLHDISQPNEPPDGVLVLLKDAKAQLMKNMNDYVKAANREMASIQRLREQQNKMIGWVSFSLLTIGTAVANNIVAIGEYLSISPSDLSSVLLNICLVVLLLAVGCGAGKLFWGPVKRRLRGTSRGVIRVLIAMPVLLLLAGLVLSMLVQYGYVSVSDAPEISEDWQPHFLI